MVARRKSGRKRVSKAVQGEGVSPQIPVVQRPPIEAFRPGTFASIQRKLATSRFVSDAELAQMLRSNAGKAMPPDVLNYLCQRLEGKTAKPRGRKPGGTHSAIREFLASVLYNRYLVWLKRRERCFGLVGWKCIADRPWWQGPPHERAARMTARALRKVWPNISYRHLLNTISSGKRLRN